MIKLNDGYYELVEKELKPNLYAKNIKFLYT